MISAQQWVAPQAIDFTGNFGRGFQIGQGIRQDQRNSAGLDVLRNMPIGAPKPQGGALAQIGAYVAPQAVAAHADGQTALVNASHAAAANAVDPTLEAYFANARKAESGGNDLAKNPKSTATGRYQFLESTWKGLMEQYPELGLTVDGRTDPAQQERAMARFTQDNARVLSGAGIPVNPGTLYAAHFLGSGGATKVLQQDPNSPLSAYLGPGVLEANPHLNGMTVGDFINWSNSKGGNGSGGYSGPTTAVDAANALAFNSAGVPDVGAGQGQPFQLTGDQLADLMGSDMTRGFAMSYLQAEQERQASSGRFVVEQGPNGAVWQRDRLSGEIKVLAQGQGGADGMTDTQRNLMWRAEQAGLQPGTPEYQQFIMSNGQGGTSLSVDPATGAVTFSQGFTGKLTEQQSKDTVYSTRARGALPTIDQYGAELTNPVARAVEGDPTGMARGAFQSPEFQKAQQAGKEFLQAVLRKDTGAAITPQETAEYGSVYLPMPGDSPEVLEQKRQSRQRALAAMEAGMPPEAILRQELALKNGANSNEPARPQTQADYDALPSGALFIDPDDGKTYRKP